jgi:anti-sigma factor RsiW
MSDALDHRRFRLDHRWAPGHMSGYLDAELSSRQRSRMDRHVAVCHQCRRLLAGLRAVLGALHAQRTPASSADAARITSSVRVRLGGPERRR